MVIGGLTIPSGNYTNHLPEVLEKAGLPEVNWAATSVHFPHLGGFDLPSPFERHIGFVLPEETDGEEGGADGVGD